MNTIFLTQEWFVICIYVFIFSAITALPDLYALYKNSKQWIPINFPPYISGDDYHYFSILNFLHRRILNLFYNYKLSFPKLATTSKFQFFGFLFNLPAYHLGFLFRDRRYGVLFVKIWNNICLGISFFLLFSVIVNLLEIKTEIFYSALSSYVAFFLLYPGPFRRRSIILNLNKNTHIQKYEHANDLLRGMFSATSAPLYLLSSSLLIYSHTINYLDPIISLLVILLIPILFFVYLPIAVVYGISVILLALLSQNFMLSAFSIIILVLLIFFYILTVRKDEVGRELYAHNNRGKIFIFNFPMIVRIVVIMIPCFLIAIYFFNKQILFMVLLILFLGGLSFTFFFKKHQLSRFYDRGSCILLQAITIIILFIILENTFSLILGILLFTLLVKFFTQQSIYLYKNSVTVCSYSVYKRINFISLFSKLKKTSNIIVTDNFIISGLVDAFGCDETLLRNYSLQSLGYKKHLENICKNFSILGYSRKSLIKILCSNVDIYDCTNKYSSEKSDIVLANCNHYYIQYILCNREFNNQIIIDRMYDNLKGWSLSFKKMVTRKFEIVANKKTILPIVII